MFVRFYQLLTCLITLISICSLQNAVAANYSIAAGSPAGLYYPYGGGLASIWSEHVDDFNIKAEVTDGSVANVIQVAVKESEIGFTQADVALEAYHGTGKFSEPLDISILFALYPNLVHIMTQDNNGIVHIDDLKGKKVSVGAPGSGTAIGALNILAVLGLTPDNFQVQYLDYGETANAIRDGNIDAGFIIGGVGVAAIVELALTRDIHIISFTDEEIALIQQHHPVYMPFSIDESMYKGVDKAQVPAVWNVLAVHNELPDDTAYALTKTAFENMDRLRQITHAANYTSVENTRAFKDVPLHPGALRYFNEI